MVVTAERESAAEARAPTSFVSVIDASEHATEGETVSDALAESVGVQVRRFGGLGAFSTLSIRGSSSNQVQIYFDGIPLSRARNETINLADLPLDSLERIEVYRGTAPVGFSGGGLGGVVNLVTKPPSATAHTELGVSYGSFDTRKAIASHSRQLRSVDLLAHVTYLGSEGDFRFLDDRGTRENPHDDRRASRRNNAFDSVEALFKGGSTLPNGLRLDLTSEAFFKDQGVPGPGNVQFPDPWLREWRALNYLRGGQEGLLDALDASGTVFGIYERTEFRDPKGDFSRLPQDRRDETTLVGGNLAGTYYPVASHALGWFSEAVHERFAGFDAKAPQSDEPDQTRLHLSLALQDQAALFAERLLVVPTLRYEHLRDDVSATFDIANRPSAQRERHATDLWSPSIGAQIYVSPWLTLRGNVGRFQRAPNFSELFGSRGSVRGNPDLHAEDGIMRDVGFAATPEGDRRLKLRLEYAYFNNDVDDIIVMIQTSPNFFTPRNVGGARIRGHEVALRTTLLGRVALDLNYTHQDAENRSASPNFRGRQLPGRPADEVYARTQLFAAQGELYYEFNLVSGNFTGERNLNRIPTRDVHTLGAVARVFDRLTLSVEARNLTDNQISDVGGFPLPGRSYFGTVKFRF